MKKPWSIFLAFVLVFILAGCSSLADSAQPNLSDQYFELSQTQFLSQSFVPQYAGLQGVEVYLRPNLDGDGILRATLQTDPARSVIASATMNLSQITQPGYYRFNFEIPEGEAFSTLYLQLEIEGSGSVQVGSAAASTYLEGGLSENGSPQSAQLTFRLTYSPFKLALSLLGEFFSWIYQFLLSLLIFLLPGFALLGLLWPGSRALSKFELTALAFGVGFVVYPLWLLWTDTLGVHLGAWNAWLPILLSAIYLIYRNRLGLKLVFGRSVTENRQAFKRANRDAFKGSNLALWCVLFLVFTVRFWVIRALPAPLWGDSLQHTMMIQLLIDHGGLFQSWRPYAELSSFTYHFGFHSATAVYHWVSGKNALDATLWVGQLLNGFAVFMLYPLVLSFNRKNRWGAIAAVAIAGLLLSMPMAYVNSGRYTQLSGQMLMPLVIVLFLNLIQKDRVDWKLIILSALTVTGLAVTHYRMFILTVAFCVLAAIFYFQKRTARATILNILLMTLISLILYSPWIINLQNSILAQSLQVKIARIPETGPTPRGFINLLDSFYPTWSWILAGLSALLLLITKRKEGLLLLLWTGLIVVLANPWWLGLAGEGIIDDLSVQFGFYFPLTLFMAFFLGSLDRPGLNAKTVEPVLALLLIGVSLFGFKQQSAILSYKDHAYLTRPDLRAFEWIKANSSQDSKFLVNFEFSYKNTAVTGIDAGWWIPLITGRATNLPPLTFTSETGYQPNYHQQVLYDSQVIQNQVQTLPESCGDFQSGAYDYIYIGQNPLKPPLFDPQWLSASSCFELIYRQDQVWIFKILRL